ncbi:MAG TPA: phosphoglucosamine mutase [Gammaproteobacteria bacterium]|jgi:phosphoglucosamine mutase|nr:phosphoglucosamine mutase [Gammaproteobacteria bacterium]
MSRKYFGTDGVRGRVGSAHMNAEFVLRLGRAAGRVLAKTGEGTVLVGKDTRISGYMFESALEAGLSAAGVNTRLLGPMPTPAIAYLTRSLGTEAGVVISASHNPYYDNGIKFFSADGRKLSDEVEAEIEHELDQPFATVESGELGNAKRIVDAAGRYVEFCKSSVPYGLKLAGLKIVLDCAHGATYKVGPAVFDDMGAKVTCIGVNPNGLNINAECGSTHPEALRQKVLELNADFGVAFDGDGDRLLMVDHKGELVDGDELLYIIAMARKADGGLKGPVVGTHMSNLGLEQAFAASGVEFKRAAVGDRYVLAMLEESGGVLGGENSGHIVCLDRATTGDGIIAALQVLQALHVSGKTLADARAPVRKYPQALVNVKTPARVDLSVARVRNAVASVEQQLAGRGRVLLRLSGTEPLVRVMVEGEEAATVARLAEDIAAAVRTAAGI